MVESKHRFLQGRNNLYKGVISMKLKNANLIVGFVCLVVGGASVYLFQNYTLKPKYALKEQIASAKPMDPLFDRFFNDDFFGRSGDPFKEMQRMREGMLKQFNQEEGGGLFDSWYKRKFGGGNAADISQRSEKSEKLDRLITFSV